VHYAYGLYKGDAHEIVDAHNSLGLLTVTAWDARSLNNDPAAQRAEPPSGPVRVHTG